MASPYTHDDALRIHDVAVWEWLGTLHVHYPEVRDPADQTLIVAERKDAPILRVFASPDRAFASLVDQLVHQGFIDGGTDAEKRAKAADVFAILPLPAISIQAAPPIPDTSLSNVPGVLYKKLLDPVTGKWKHHRWPKHYFTDYIVTVWSKQRFTANYIQEWLAAQMGNLGRAHNETMLTVQHKAPWGPIQQMLRLSSPVTDQTELEGDEARYFRYEFTLTLRTHVTMPEMGEAEFVEARGIDTDVGESGEVEDQLVRTENLFPNTILLENVAEDWPVSGGAVVTTEDKQTLQIELGTAGDAVELACRKAKLDGNANAIISVSFDYTADEAFALDMLQQEPPSDSLSNADRVVVPRARVAGKVHQFMLVNQSVFTARTVFEADPVSLELSNVDIRRYYVSGAKQATAVVPISGHNRYIWSGLARRAYLVVLEFTATDMPRTVVLADDDASAGATELTRTVDAAKAVGTVFIVTPQTHKLRLDVPNGVTVTRAFAMPYVGPYHGNKAQ